MVGFSYRRTQISGSQFERAFMDIEKDLIDAFESLVRRNFPNPHRVGCPGNEVLAQFALRPSGAHLSHLLTHLQRCAPCFHELKELRKGHSLS